MKTVLRLLSFSVPIGILLCIIGQMVVANQMIVLANRLGQVNRRIDELTVQNEYLEKRLTDSSSIQRVNEQAKKLGFVDATQYLAFDEESYPVAIKR